MSAEHRSPECPSTTMFEQDGPESAEAVPFSPQEIGRILLDKDQHGTDHTTEHNFGPDIQRRAAMLDHFEHAYGHIHGTLLRAHQKDATGGMYDFLLTPQPSDSSDGMTKRGVIAHAPGAGKTILAAETCVMLGLGSRLVAGDRPIRTIFFAHERKAIAQNMGAEDIPRGLAVVAPEIPTYTVGGNTHAVSKDIPAVGMTYAAMRNWFKKDPSFFDDFDITVSDEGQEALGPHTRSVLAKIMERKINLALSGSVELADGRTMQDLWPEVIHEISLREGVEERGILNSFILYSFNVHNSLKGILKDGEFSSRAYRHLIEDTFINRQIHRLALLLASHNMKTAIYAYPGSESSHAQLIANNLDGASVTDRAMNEPRTIRAAAIGGFLPDWKNRQIFDDFDNGKIDVISSVRLGEAAWDPKELDAVILPCPTTSLRAIIQRIGRAARLSTRPTVIIHFNYGHPDQVSPFDAFDEPLKPYAVIAPQQSPYHDIARFLEVSNGTASNANRNTPQYTDQDAVPHKWHAPALPFLDASNSDVPILFDELRTLIEAAELEHGERLALRRGKADLRNNGFGRLSPIAETHDIDEHVLAGLLRRNGFRIVSYDEADGTIAYCQQEEVEKFIIEHVASPSERTMAEMAAILETNVQWVKNRVNKASGVSKFSRRSLTIRKQTHFTQDVLDKLQAAKLATAQPAEAGLISAVELGEKYGVSTQQTVDWLGNHGIQPVRRKGTQGTNGAVKGGIRYFSRDHEDLFAWHFSSPRLPKDKNLMKLSEVFSKLKLRLMDQQQAEAVVIESGIKPVRYRTATRSTYYITKDDYEAVRRVANATRAPSGKPASMPSATEYAKKLDKESFNEFLRARGKQPPQPIQQVSVTTDTAVSTIAVARRLNGRIAGSRAVESKAQEYGIRLEQRIVAGKAVAFMDNEDVELFVERYQKESSISSRASVAQTLQIPENFVQQMAVESTDVFQNSRETDEHAAQRAALAVEAFTETEWRKTHKLIVGALRNLKIPRPDPGQILDEETLHRVHAQIVMLGERTLRSYVYAAAMRDRAQTADSDK